MVLLLKPLVGVTLLIIYCNATPPPGYVKVPSVDKDPPKYQYGYDIASTDDGTGHGKSESRDGEFAHGKYYVHLPRKGASSRVRYFADDWGYHPVVEYSTNDGYSKVTAQFALGEHAVKALKDGGEVGQSVSKKPTQSTYETIQSVPYSSRLQAGPDSSVNQQHSQILVPYTTNVQHSGPADTSANIQIQPTGNAQSSIIHDPNSSPNNGNVYVDNVNQQQHQPGLNLQGQNNGVATSSQHSIIYTNGEGGDGGNSGQASYNSQVSSAEQPSSQVTYYQNNGGNDGGDGYSGSSQSSGGEQQLVYLQNGDEGGNANQIVEHQQVNQIQHQQQLDDKQNINGAVSNQFITQVLHSQVDGGQNGHENHQQTVSYQSDASQGDIQQGSNEGLYLQADGHQNTVEIGNNNAYSTQSFSNEISERRKGVQNVFILDGNHQNEIKQQSESYVQDGAALQAYGNQGEQLGHDVSGEQVSEVDLNQSFHQTRINLENAGGYGTKIIHTQTSDSGQNENLFKSTAQSTSVFSTGQGTGQGYNTYAKLVKSTQNLITGKDVLDLNSAVENNQEAVSNVANSVSVTTAKPERLYSKLAGSRKNINIGGFFKDLKSSIHGHLLNHDTHKISEQKFAKPIVVPDFTSTGVSVTTEPPALSITGSIEINSNFNEKSDYFSTTQNTIETEVNKVVHNNPTEPSIIVTPRPVSNNFLAPITAALRLQNSGEKLENIITDCHGEGILKQNAHLGTVVEVQKSVPYYIGQFAYYDNKGALNQISDHHSQQQIVSLNGAYQNDQSVYQQTGVGISENQHFINEQAALTHNAQLIDVSHKEQTVEEVSNTNQNIEIHDQHAELSVQTADVPVHKVEVPVPYPVEKIVEKHVPVPKPYPVEVTKIVEKPVEVIKYIDKPYPVEVQVPVHIPVEVKVPYPVEKHIRVPVEVQKIVEKPIHITKYVDKPYPVHVPQPYPVEVEKIVEKQVPVQVTKYVDKPYPVEVKVPHPVPYPVEKIVEKTKYVDKPYPVKVPYPVHVPVEVKVPVEVTKYVDKPYPVEKIVEKEVRVPVTVEKIVEKPVTKIVEKPYPVHIKVPVPHPVPVEVKVPQPYPVEVKVPQPYAVHVPQPVPVQVTKLVSVPVEVPKYIKQYIERPYPVFVHEHKKHNHEDQSVVQSIQHHTAHILQPVYQQHYGYLGGYGYKDASFQHLNNQAYAVQKQIQQQQSQHQLQQFQQHQHQAQQIQQNQHLTQQIQQSSQQSEHIQQNVKHQSQQVQQSQNYYSYAPSYQILVPKHLSAVHKQPIGHGTVSLQTYALNTKPCDFVGHVQHKGHDFTNLALLKYRRNAHPQPNRSNFGKNLRIEYGFQPPMRPSVETDEQGTPLKKEDN